MYRQETLQGKSKLLENEQGVTIVTVLLLLMLLTLMGVTATKTVINEKKSVRSEAVFEQSFYFAESACLEGVQKMENESTPEELLAPLIVAGAANEKLLISAHDEEPFDDTKNLDLDGDTNIDKDDLDLLQVSETNADTHRAVVQMPIASGDSLALGSSRIYSYMSYGMTSAQGGHAMIKLGYKKRF